MKGSDSWLISPDAIRESLVDIARNMISYAVALQVSGIFRQRMGNLDMMPKDCHNLSKDALITSILGRVALERKRISMTIDEDDISQAISDKFNMLEACLLDGTDEWKRLIPGRPIISAFSSKANLKIGRLKMLFLKEAEEGDFSAFGEIVKIFDHFSSFSN